MGEIIICTSLVELMGLLWWPNAYLYKLNIKKNRLSSFQWRKYSVDAELSTRVDHQQLLPCFLGEV